MSESNEKFERFASYIDGEPVNLSEAELREAEEIRADIADISADLSVAVPAETLAKAMRVVKYQARPIHWKRIRFAFYGGIQAAAVIAMAVGLARLLNPDRGFLPDWGLTYQQAMMLWQPVETQTRQQDLDAADPLDEIVKLDEAIMGILGNIVQGDSNENEIDESDWMEWFQKDNSSGPDGMGRNQQIS